MFGKLLLSLTIMLAAAAAARAQHADATSRRAELPAPVSDELRRRILSDRESVWRAWFTNDQAKLQALIPEEAVAINAGEEAWANRGAILEGAKQFAAGGSKLVSLEFPRTEIQMYGNTIILYTTYAYELEKDGKRSKYGGRGTEIFVLRGGKLVNTGWHLDSGN